MSPRTDHPPSSDETSRGTAVRRAVVGGVAGVALLVGPVALANVIVPDGGDSDQVEAAAAESETSLIALRREMPEADRAKAAAQVSLRTTTTTAPPTTTTTAPPPTTTTAPPTTTTAPPTTAPPATEPPPSSTDTGGGFGDPGDFATWDALANCESGGNWAINTGNGYYGGLQFSAGTWAAVGGTGLPHEHPRETQIHFGQVLQARSGWGQWPHCSAQLGLI